MIISPLNDQECLGSITAIVRSLVDQQAPELHALARDLGSCGAAIRWMRSLPQRDDIGEAGDGPRIDSCEPPQRLRLPAPDPNCVERAALYLVLGEFLEPRPSRRLATIDTPVGRHTLPVENGSPVVLDPRVPRNCARAGIDVLGATPAPTDIASCASWVCNVAAEPAQQLPGGPRRLREAGAALAGAIQGVAVCPTAMDDVAMALALAAREAHQWGPAGIGVVDRVAQAVLDHHGLIRVFGDRADALTTWNDLRNFLLQRRPVRTDNQRDRYPVTTVGDVVQVAQFLDEELHRTAALIGDREIPLHWQSEVRRWRESLARVGDAARGRKLDETYADNERFWRDSRRFAIHMSVCRDLSAPKVPSWS